MLYKYVGHEDPNELIKILKFFIEDGTIRATRPHDFNDPAEFKAKFSFDATIQEKRVRYHEMWPGKSDDDGENWLRGRTKNAEEFDAYMLRGNLAVYKMLCPTDSYQLKRVELDKNLTFQGY